MLRPITSFEIGLLVRLLVALSVRLNAALGLTGGSRNARGGSDVRQQQRQQQQGEEEEEVVEHRLQVRMGGCARQAVQRPQPHECFERHQPCKPQPLRPLHQQELLARARRRGFRINLRPLGDVRNLLWIPVAYLVLLHGVRLVWWLVVTIATGAAESSAGSAGGTQRHYHQHHEH